MALPADHLRESGRDDAVAHQAVEQDDQRPTDEDRQRDANEHRPSFSERRLAVGRLHQRDQLADQHRQQRVEQGDAERGGEHRQEYRLGLANEMPVEREQSGGRATATDLLRRRHRARQQGFEEAEHGSIIIACAVET
jgi:hypothetical protein